MGMEGGEGGRFLSPRLDLRRRAEMKIRRVVGRRKIATECRKIILLDQVVA